MHFGKLTIRKWKGETDAGGVLQHLCRLRPHQIILSCRVLCPPLAIIYFSTLPPPFAPFAVLYFWTTYIHPLECSMLSMQYNISFLPLLLIQNPLQYWSVKCYISMMFSSVMLQCWTMLSVACKVALKYFSTPLQPNPKNKKNKRLLQAQTNIFLHLRQLFSWKQLGLGQTWLVQNLNFFCRLFSRLTLHCKGLPVLTHCTLCKMLWGHRH